MTRKHIAHITFDMRIGGAEQVIYQLIEHTDKNKYRISLFCIDSPVGPFGKQLQSLGYEIHSASRKPGFDLGLVKQARQFIKKHRIDMVHCHQYTPYVYGVLGAIGTGAKVIFTEHGRFYPDTPSRKRKLINPILSLITTHITSISRATKEALNKVENFPAHKISVVYNGLDGGEYLKTEARDLKNDLMIPKDFHVLGTVARLDPIKNQSMMLKALVKVLEKHPKTCLVMVGDGPERKNLEDECQSLGLDDNVIFTGYRNDIPEVLRTIDIFLLTSFSEGTAMTLLEAMAARRPCIVTEVGGNPEIVVDNETGFWVRNNDEDDLAEKICLLFSDPEKHKKMGEKGRLRFLSNFTVQKMVSQYQALYGV